MTRRERRQLVWLFITPLLIFGFLLVGQMRNAAPLFPVPAGTQFLEGHWSPLARLGGSAYVQRVQSPLSPAKFWEQITPLLEARGMKPREFSPGPDANQAEVRNSLQQSFRHFGLTQTALLTSGCAFSGGSINGANYNVYFWPNEGGTRAEFWLRDPLR